MAHSETVERILDAAEQLFAERGFAETSLRLITGRARVNLAAVNYHFGSKEALIQAVFVRFLGPLSQRLERELARRQGRAPLLEELLELLAAQALAVAGDCDKLIGFMRLLGMAVRQHQQELHVYLGGLYGKVFRRYLQQLQEALPGVPPLELFWRAQFALGAATFSLAGLSSLRGFARSDFGVDTSAEQVLGLMVPFLAAGLRAESSLTDARLIAARPCPRPRANHHGR
ncbi:TetR family transcriptional regulator [Pseudomonas stutzeri]|nr:TetR family transcriptional regulator [Stutzerimonas stutzeri]